jgi:hypothetical protein
VTTATYCDPVKAWDLLPSEKRHNVYAQITKEVGEKLHLYADFIYSSRRNVQNVTRGSASGTVYGTGYTGVLPAAVRSTRSQRQHDDRELERRRHVRPRRIDHRHGRRHLIPRRCHL